MISWRSLRGVAINMKKIRKDIFDINVTKVWLRFDQIYLEKIINGTHENAHAIL